MASFSSHWFHRFNDRQKLFEFVETFVYVSAGIKFIERFVAFPTFVTGKSMLPTFAASGDVALVKSRDRSAPVGSIVICTSPVEPQKALIKRVAGVEGEIVLSRARNKAWKIPKDHVFIAGDNTWNSQDSRDFGPVPKGLIVGTVVCKLWPWGEIPKHVEGRGPDIVQVIEMESPNPEMEVKSRASEEGEKSSENENSVKKHVQVEAVVSSDAAVRIIPEVHIDNEKKETKLISASKSDIKTIPDITVVDVQIEKEVEKSPAARDVSVLDPEAQVISEMQNCTEQTTGESEKMNLTDSSEDMPQQGSALNVEIAPKKMEMKVSNGKEDGSGTLPN